jgi:hypothetical protein
MIKTENQRTFGLVLVCMFLFAGCGGGGGGGGGALAPDDLRDLARARVSEVSTQLAQAAENAPNEGSVTQSSNGNGAVTPTTTDSVDVEILERAGSEYTFTVTKTGAGNDLDWTITQDDLRDDSDFADDIEDDVEVAIGFEAGRRVNNGTLRVGFFTNIESASDTDWLAGGIWLYVPDTVSGPSDIEFGAFMDGNQPFTSGNIDGLTGSATYNGAATGLYTDGGASEEAVGYFEADVELTADFGGPATPGSISGTVSEIFLDDDDNPLDSEIMLDPATITDAADGGFFTGDVTALGLDAPADFDGRWGGQFFGNGSDATTHPTTVGGTFGGASITADTSFVGAFGALRE